jgi:hypothetical protein
VFYQNPKVLGEFFWAFFWTFSKKKGGGVNLFQMFWGSFKIVEDFLGCLKQFLAV